MPFKQYMSPEDRLKVSGGKGAAPMGGMSEAAPGQMEDEHYDENAAPAPAEKSGAGETAMVPIALLGGKEFKPGEEVVMKVVKIDKENGTVEIAYATDDHDNEHPAMGMGEEEHPAVAGMP